MSKANFVTSFTSSFIYCWSSGNQVLRNPVCLWINNFVLFVHGNIDFGNYIIRGKKLIFVVLFCYQQDMNINQIITFFSGTFYISGVTSSESRLN